MIIEIIVKNEEGEILGKRTSFSFESAEENLGKLENMFVSPEDEKMINDMAREHGQAEELGDGREFNDTQENLI